MPHTRPKLKQNKLSDVWVIKSLSKELESIFKEYLK